MAASTLRLVLIVALVVGGVVLINRAFPEATGGSDAVPDGGAVVTDSPTPSPTEDESPSPTPSPTVTGTRIAVFNGAAVTGLAAETLDRLIEEGYVAGQEAADAPSPFSVTTVYFRSPREDRIEAEFLANDFFRRLDDVIVARLPANADVDESVQVAIYLGTDYATLRAGRNA